MGTTQAEASTEPSQLPRSVAALFGSGGEIGVAWGSTPAHVRHTGLAELVPPADELLRTPLLRPPLVTVLVDGRVVPPSRYCRSDRIVNVAQPEQLVDAELLYAQLSAGAAVKLNRMELWCPQIARLADAIGAACRKRVKVWGFLSPHGEMLVPPHRDPAHVVAVQVTGRKLWHLGGHCPEGPWSAMERLPVGTDSVVELTGDDVLYLPYGYAHSAAARTEMSFHVSFALEGTTAGELRHRVLKHLADRLDGSDSTEVREDNLALVLSDLRLTLAEVADGLADVPRHEAGEICAGRTAEVIDDLLRAVTQKV